MTPIREILAASPVMPVIVLDRVEDAVPLAEALVSGGIRVLEVTMRTSAALDCVRAIRAAVPNAIVGVGTITNIADMNAAREVGAMFGVSPGTTPALLSHAATSGFPFLPGSHIRVWSPSAKDPLWGNGCTSGGVISPLFHFHRHSHTTFPILSYPILPHLSPLYRTYRHSVHRS